MASIGHVAVGMAAGRFAGGRRLWPMIAYAAFAMLPDLDTVAFRLGIPYEAPFGHRGALHSLAFAASVGLVVILLTWRTGRGVWTGGLTFAVVASHGLLDTLTDGGLGVALLWPFSDERFFAPLRVIPVAPIGRRMLSARGLHVMAVELLLFAPFFVYALWPQRRAGPAAADARAGAPSVPGP